MKNEAMWLLIGGTIAASVSETWRWLLSRSKRKGEDKKADAEADGTQIRTTLETLDVAWERARDLEYKVEYLNTVVDALLAQLRENNIMPIYPPMPPRSG